jgi:putative colanic acid biosynthesis glycosyltransferase WcaI
VRVLLLGLNFAPELIGVGKYTAEFAAWLTERGHEVRVITAPPYYPDWQVGRGYAAWRYRREIVAGAQTLRCPLWVPAAPTPAKRILHLLSFALSSCLPTLWQAVRWRPDVVWTVEPTTLTAPSALLAARLAGARACLHVQDLELEGACALGMLCRPRLQRALRTAYGWLLRRFDLVSTISARMRRQLAAHGLAAERLCRFPNWVDTSTIRPLEQPNPLRRALGLGADQVVVLYAGNMGEKQGLQGLARVADRLADRPEIQLVLCGAGAVRPRLERLMAGRSNVRMLPLQPRERLNELLNLADIHILPQRPQAASFALPSKLGGVLASGRPFVAQAEDGELARAAGAGGVAVAPGDPAPMAEAILALAADAERRRRLGQGGRRFAEAHLDRDLIIQQYVDRMAAGVRAAGSARSWWQRLRAHFGARRPRAIAAPYAMPARMPSRRP